MIFRPGTKLYFYEVIRESGQDVMYINYLGAPFVPSVADSAIAMARAIDFLIESPTVSRLVFVQQRNYSYDFTQVAMLLEMAQIYTYLVKQEQVLSPEKLAPLKCQKCLPERFNKIRNLVLILLKQDPVGCYVEARRVLREEKINAEKLPSGCTQCSLMYISLISKIIDMLEKTAIIKQSQPLEARKIGDRTVYSGIFRPAIIPNFTFTRLMASLPVGAELIEEYTIGEDYDKSTVTIMKMPNMTQSIYHLMPPEFTLEEEFYNLLDLARAVLIEHKPRAEEFVDPQRTRQVFFNIARDLLQELAKSKNITLSYRQLNKLATILVRYTIGFGLVEVLLQDEKLQDIVINAPVGQVPIYVRHQDFDECTTNIIPNPEDADSWAARFRMLSGRPLDEANPILDTELTVGKIRARVAVIQQPLSPSGLSYALRRHRESPWTLPLFIKSRMISPLAAGLLSFLIDGARTILVAGTRSAGKTSLLGSLMLEIMPKNRVITIEDTLELPVDSLRKLNYDILRMKVRGALLKESAEISADEGIRTSLRLGDSCLIVGEVRSVEAKALYEAMRIGALANTVAGTIHGASPYGVFDRVVNDLGVPVTSFKATDLIIVANPIKSPDGIHSWKRVTQISEVRKHWTKDPQEEGGFVDLMRYNVNTDQLEPTDELINGDSEIIKAVAANVKGWAGNWDAVWDNILLRTKIKEELFNQAQRLKMPDLLEAPFIVASNNAFHEVSDKITQQVGVPDSKLVFREWELWFKEELRKKIM